MCWQRIVNKIEAGNTLSKATWGFSLLPGIPECKTFTKDRIVHPSVLQHLGLVQLEQHQLWIMATNSTIILQWQNSTRILSKLTHEQQLGFHKMWIGHNSSSWCDTALNLVLQSSRRFYWWWKIENTSFLPLHIHETSQEPLHCLSYLPSCDINLSHRWLQDHKHIPLMVLEKVSVESPWR